nr:hypothetical protein [Mesorhizobium loti]
MAGATADLIVVEKNPLENVAVLADAITIKMVVQDGKVVIDRR